MIRSSRSSITYLLTVLAMVVLIAVSVSGCIDQNNTGNGSEQQTDGSKVDLEALHEAAAALSTALDQAVRDLPEPEITRKEVYRIKAGKRISRKTIKERGGADRYFQIYKIKKGDRIYKRINGKSYRKNPIISLADLRYIRTLYYDFDGKIRSGEIIVNKSIARDTRAVFRELFDIRYQICKMRLVDEYFPGGSSGNSAGAGGSAAAVAADTASMNDDNTSGFNYRMVAGTSSLSVHGYGRAIDVNPFENPWCPGGKLYYNQKKSAAYANRTIRKDHMIYADSEITKIFKKHGFRWLGETGTRDYQHFEK